MTIDCRLLGALEIWVDGRPIDFGHARQRCVLAVLLLEANSTITTSSLIERIWGSEPPPTARNLLHGYVSRLRDALTAGGAAGKLQITRRSSGYSADVATSAVDLFRFRGLIAQARAASGTWAADLYDAALSSWRGPLCSDLASPWLDETRGALAEERFAALLDRGEAVLAAGRYAELIADLEEMAETHPLDERLVGQLIIALHRSGRRAEALERYHATRVTLADELGIDPGQQLRELYLSILRDDVTLAAPPHEETLPVQLPRDVAHFTGREAELGQLTELVSASSSTVEIALIEGTGGVGKTALAVRFAHQVAQRFPDGSLYINLRGYDADRPALEAGQALGQLLRGLGVSPARIPLDLEEQAGLYRTLLAGRRLLIVLDNAASASQIRPLIPGQPGCSVIVTSRNRLNGLVAHDGARRIQLTGLSQCEAVLLLTRLVGADRVAAEPAQTTELARLCGRLPLELRIAAEHVVMYRHVSMATLVDQLACERDRLDVFTPAATTSARSRPPSRGRIKRCLQTLRACSCWGYMPGAN